MPRDAEPRRVRNSLARALRLPARAAASAAVTDEGELGSRPRATTASAVGGRSGARVRHSIARTPAPRAGRRFSRGNSLDPRVLLRVRGTRRLGPARTRTGFSGSSFSAEEESSSAAFTHALREAVREPSDVPERPSTTRRASGSAPLPVATRSIRRVPELDSGTFWLRTRGSDHGRPRTRVASAVESSVPRIARYRPRDSLGRLESRTRPLIETTRRGRSRRARRRGSVGRVERFRRACAGRRTPRPLGSMRRRFPARGPASSRSRTGFGDLLSGRASRSTYRLGCGEPPRVRMLRERASRMEPSVRASREDGRRAHDGRERPDANRSSARAPRLALAHFPTIASNRGSPRSDARSGSVLAHARCFAAAPGDTWFSSNSRRRKSSAGSTSPHNAYVQAML